MKMIAGVFKVSIEGLGWVERKGSALACQLI